MFVPIEKKYIPEITALHLSSGIKDLITDLGEDFLSKAFYSETVSSNLGFGYIYLVDSKVVGFVTGSLDSTQYYKKMISGKWLFLAFTLLKKLLKQPFFFKDIMEAAFFMMEYPEVPFKPDLCYIAVDYRFRGKGIAKQLVRKLIEHLQAKNLPGCWTKTEKKNVSAGRLYQSCGFKLFKETKFRNKGISLYAIDFSLTKQENCLRQ